MNNIINYKQKLQNEYNLKIFTDNIEYECLEQIELLLQQDMFKDCKIRIMPDCHSGKGCVIGFTANLEDKVIPNIVGVDIGCGLYCVSLGKISLNFQWLDEARRIDKYRDDMKTEAFNLINKYFWDLWD
jgi:RNA-splicing ligase RtcB